MKKCIFIVVVFGLIFFSPSSRNSRAQSNDNFAIQSDGNGVNLYTFDYSGDFVLLHSFTEFYIYDNNRFNSEDAYQVIHAEEIALSPNHKKLAFGGVKLATNESVIFIYDIEQSTLETTMAPGLGHTIWSPDSEKILLVPPELYWGANYPYLQDIYVYNLLTESFTLLVSGKQTLGMDFSWLPDFNQIVYVGPNETCDTQPCLEVRNLYIVDVQGQNNRRLTNLARLSAEDLGLPIANLYRCTVTKPTWSISNERVYFSLDCQDAGETTFSSLHSVTLTGDDRLETHLMNLAEDITHIQILDIFISSTDDVYISSVGSNREVVDGLINILGFWSVIKINESEALSLVESQIFNDLSESPVYASSLSPNGTMIALSGGNMDGQTLDTSGYLAILDVQTGQITEYHADDSVCNEAWIDIINCLMHLVMLHSVSRQAPGYLMSFLEIYHRSIQG